MMMMRTIERRSSSHSTLTTTLLTVLFLVLLGAVNQAQAQWTTGTDISNTNSGKVGIGTTSPQSPLHVYKQNNGAITGIIADNDGTGGNTGQAFQFRYGST